MTVPRAIVVCLSERTVLGEPRWFFQSFSAKRRGFLTLLCRCNSTNTAIRDFYLLPTVSHLPICSLLKENDQRLAQGMRVGRLSRLPRMLNALVCQSPLKRYPIQPRSSALSQATCRRGNPDPKQGPVQVPDLTEFLV